MTEALRNNLPGILVLLLLLLVGAILTWGLYERASRNEAYQRELAKRSVDSAAIHITLRIEALQTALGLYVSEHEPQLRQLVDNPDDEHTFLHLSEGLAAYLPEFIAFTVTDEHGTLFYDDFGEQIGNLCRNDIRAYAGGPYALNLYLHPGPSEPHLDVMLPWEYATGKLGVFVATFRPDMIAQLLHHTELPGHRLIVTRADNPGLIEVTAQGPRAVLERSNRLSIEELDRVVYSSPVKHSNWVLMDLPQEGYLAAQRLRQRNQVFLIWVGLLLVSLVVLRIIHSVNRQRTAAQVALGDAYADLEVRVRERTEELQLEVEERTRAESQMRKLSSAIEQSDDAVLITNRDGIVEYVNTAYEKTTGFSRGEVLGKSPSIVKSGLHDVSFYDNLWNTIEKGEPFREVFINRKKEGAIYYEEKTITPIKDEQGNITHFVSTGKDITERMEIQERLQYLAHHDLLTGLPNRVLLQDRLRHALGQARRSGMRVALLFLDLDRFKTINDSLGHGVGDRLLNEVAERLSASVRETDTIARVGGDEFTVVLEGLDKPGYAAGVARTIFNALRAPCVIEGHEIVVTTSIGIAIYPDNAETIDDLLKNADSAMYRAKESGRNNYQFFTADMTTRAMERLEMENRLRHALERDEFVLHYQPRVDLRTGEVCGMEALLRWQHRELGLVAPQEFIPLLEETGLIVPVGEWVLRSACAFNRSLQRSGYSELRVSVNLSARQFRDPKLVDTVLNALQENALESRHLELEITESLLMENLDLTTEILHILHERGVRISVDDFGTGYSSMGYLKRFPIDTIKIDRSFVRDILVDADDEAIVTAIIAMARSLRLRVTAEGIETEAQLDALRAQGCDELQGYLVGRPVPQDEFPEAILASKISANL